jgi:hypothetical protein
MIELLMSDEVEGCGRGLFEYAILAFVRSYIIPGWEGILVHVRTFLFSPVPDAER